MPDSKPDPALAEIVRTGFTIEPDDREPQLVQVGQEGGFAVVALDRVVQAAPAPDRHDPRQAARGLSRRPAAQEGAPRRQCHRQADRRRHPRRQGLRRRRRQVGRGLRPQAHRSRPQRPGAAAAGLRDGAGQGQAGRRAGGRRASSSSISRRSRAATRPATPS
ncbi:MAG: hypothetical protein WDN24_07530 [Sphingomonas sp.]